MEAEKATKFVQEIQRETKGLRANADVIGTQRDSPQVRRKLELQRKKVSDAEAKLQGLLRAATPGDRVWDEINMNFRQAKKEFEAASLAAKKKEKDFPMSSQGGPGGREGDGAASGGGGDGAVAINIHEFKRVDMSELATEEALQNEKYRGVVEIQQEMADLHSAYSQFQGLVNEQQSGLDKMETDVVKAKTHVEKGVDELKGASTQQKKGRKMMCVIVLLLTVIIAIVVVVVVVMKK